MAAKKTAAKAAKKPAANAKADQDKAKEVEAAFADDDPVSDEALAQADAALKHYGFTAENLIGQLADYLIEDARTEREPWSKLAQHEQEAIIVEQGRRARFLIADIVKAIANKGLNYMETTIEGGSFKLGDGAIKLKVVVDFTPEHAEWLAEGSIKGVLVLASLKEFEGRASIESEPDQAPLLGDGDDDPPHDPDTGEILDEEAEREEGDAPVMQDIDEETEENARKRAP